MVAAYSPHRHQGDSTAFFSRPHSRSPSTRHSLLHPSAACPSPFTLALGPTLATAKTRSAARRSSTLRSRGESGSPVKFPLRLTASSMINKSPRSLARRSGSPPDKRAARLSDLDSSPSDDGRSPTGSGSPLPRSEGSMHLDEASRGSPISKRRSVASSASLQGLRGRQHVFGSPSLGGASPHPAVSPERNLFPQPRMPPPKMVNGTIRRVASQQVLNVNRESPFNHYRHAALNNASVHAHNGVPHPPIPLGLSEIGSAPNQWVTPNYKDAKPDPSAFYSTGFVPKRNRNLNRNNEVQYHQPDTPCKKNPGFSAFSTLQQRGAPPKVPFWNMPQTPTAEPRMRQNRRDSFASTDESDELFDGGKASDDFDLPPTPTRKAPRKGYQSLFSGSKRLRTETSADGLFRFPPQTPNQSVIPPDPSSLSISGHSKTMRNSVPATPSPDIFGQFQAFSSPSNLSEFSLSPSSPAASWMSRYVVELIGAGEFSDVFKATEKETSRHPVTQSSQLATPSNSSSFESMFDAVPAQPRTYAVKRLKEQFRGPKDRATKYEEVRILQALNKHNNIIEFVDSWVEDERLHIATEFCCNGSLDAFLTRHGEKGRLDEFRVWKVMLELGYGIEHIHGQGFLHLDLKPANVLISFDGTLKISDFGLALEYPAPKDIEREGDREYIAPEVLSRSAYDRPVDIFSLGLTMIETAGNEGLPPNGHEWHQLRDGDITVAPILSTSSSGEFVHRDEEGNPIGTDLILDDDADGPFSPSASDSCRIPKGRTLHIPRPGDRLSPPLFMEEGGLERIVSWMISPLPENRPTIGELLGTNELRWIEYHRQCPATIFEGLWGPENVRTPAKVSEGHEEASIPEFNEDAMEL